MNRTSEKAACRQIIVRLKNDTHRALRIRVAEGDSSIQKWVEHLIERELGIIETNDNVLENKKENPE